MSQVTLDKTTNIITFGTDKDGKEIKPMGNNFLEGDLPPFKIVKAELTTSLRGMTIDIMFGDQSTKTGIIISVGSLMNFSLDGKTLDLNNTYFTAKSGFLHKYEPAQAQTPVAPTAPTGF